MKKMLFGVFALSLATSAFAADLKITDFYRLDPQNTRDRAAEVCFSVNPAPSAPVMANITVDKGTNSEGHYSAWIGSKGKTCQVVATFRGRVEVEIPEKAVKTKSL